ncbi:MAG: response regulator [Acidobacteria bacterium]|nr:response regulator [Acidobacteriota bacterium]
MPRILVADDDAVQLDLRKLLLEAAGHEVYLAYSARTALRTLRERGADLVILDLRFPNAEGRPDAREGLALIRGIHEAGAAVPVLVLSGWPEDIDGQPERKLVRRVLTKPVKPSALMQVVRDILS